MFAAVALLPVAAWALRNAMLDGYASRRPLAWHPITLSQLRGGVLTVWRWAVPEGIPPAAWALAAVVAASLAAAATLVRSTERRSSPIVLLAALATGVYVLFLLATISLFDAGVALDRASSRRRLSSSWSPRAPSRTRSLIASYVPHLRPLPG